MDKKLKSKLFSIISILSILLIVFFAVKHLSIRADNLDTDTGMVVQESPALAEQYIVPKLNTLYVYYAYSGDQTIEDSKPYKNEIVIENKDGYVQKKTVMADFTEYDELIQDIDGKAILVGSSSVNTRESLIDNITMAPYNNVFDTTGESVILSEPISLHNTWQYSESAVSEITNLNTLVELPFGNFTAIEVVTNFEDGRFRKDYYVKFLGLVKSVVSDAAKGDQTIYLHDVRDESILSKAYLFTYDAFTNSKSIELIDNHISTNPVYIEILENMLKYEKNASGTSLIKDETSIQSVTIDRREDIAYIDFSSGLLINIDFGDQVIIEMLRDIANVVGNFYQVGNVKITADGANNIAGKIDLSKPYEVDLQER